MTVEQAFENWAKLNLPAWEGEKRLNTDRWRWVKKAYLAGAREPREALRRVLKTTSTADDYRNGLALLSRLGGGVNATK